jgi:hypothetical protein
MCREASGDGHCRLCSACHGWLSHPCWGCWGWSGIKVRLHCWLAAMLLAECRQGLQLPIAAHFSSFPGQKLSTGAGACITKACLATC